MEFIKEFLPIPYIGTSSSHFQSEPVMYAEDGSILPPSSDWEYELSKNLAGLPSGIHDPQSLDELPHFLSIADRYIARNRELYQNMFCFSLEWGRLCRKPFEFDEKLMTEYVRVLAMARAANQEPLLTLHHFTVPLYLAKVDAEGKIIEGGWEHPDVLKHFRFFASKVVDFLSDDAKMRTLLGNFGYGIELQERFVEEGLCRHFITLNEPAIVALMGYVVGDFPPFKKSRVFGAKKVLETMAKAHDMAREELQRLGVGKKPDRKPRVGVAHACQYYDGVLGGRAERVSEYAVSVFEKDGTHSDFFGLHYYFRESLLPIMMRRKKLDFGDQPTFGDIFPLGILRVLKKMSSLYPNKDIFISEIGFADTVGIRRPEWLAETIKYIMEARRDGLPIKAILFWSLVNNFEWNLGMRVAKFGMFSEKELLSPLPEKTDRVHSWQVWLRASRALRTPSDDTLAELEEVHELAEKKYQDFKRSIAP